MEVQAAYHGRFVVAMKYIDKIRDGEHTFQDRERSEIQRHAHHTLF